MKLIAISLFILIFVPVAKAGWQEDADKICHTMEKDAPNFCATPLAREAAYILITNDASDAMDLIEKCVAKEASEHGMDKVTALDVRCCVKERAMSEAGFPDYRCDPHGE